MMLKRSYHLTVFRLSGIASMPKLLDAVRLAVALLQIAFDRRVEGGFGHVLLLDDSGRRACGRKGRRARTPGDAPPMR